MAMARRVEPDGHRSSKHACERLTRPLKRKDRLTAGIGKRGSAALLINYSGERRRSGNLMENFQE